MEEMFVVARDMSERDIKKGCKELSVVSYELRDKGINV